MSRRKDKVFEEVEFGPFKAKIRVNSNGVFSCAYGEESHSGQLPEVRSWARERMRDLSQLKWEPVIAVTFGDTDMSVNNLRNGANLECYMERFYIAWAGKKWIRTPWAVMPPGTSMVCGPNRTDMEQSEYEMTETELAQQRIRESSDFYEADCVVNLQWPLIGDKMGDDKVYHIPYTEERWQTILGIQAKMIELRKALHKMLTTEQGWTKLAEVAQTKLLTA